MLKVYLETTIPSYLTAKPSRDLVIAARQEITREWWENKSSQEDLFASELVLRECAGGDTGYAKKRMELLDGITVLDACENSIQIAERLVEEKLVPEKAAQDAVHIGIATVHDMDVLLTWNCTHLANGTIMRRLAQFIRSLGYEPPAICTPEELIGD